MHSKQVFYQLATLPPIFFFLTSNSLNGVWDKMVLHIHFYTCFLLSSLYHPEYKHHKSRELICFVYQSQVPSISRLSGIKWIPNKYVSNEKRPSWPYIPSSSIFYSTNRIYSQGVFCFLFLFFATYRSALLDKTFLRLKACYVEKHILMFLLPKTRYLINSVSRI